MKKEKLIKCPKLMAIAKKIKELRIQKGYASQESFAWKNNLDRVQYGRIEKGSNLTFKTFFMILNIHQMSPFEFFKDFDS